MTMQAGTIKKCKKVQALMNKGVTNAAACKKIGVSTQSFYEWLKNGKPTATATNGKASKRKRRATATPAPPPEVTKLMRDMEQAKADYERVRHDLGAALLAWWGPFTTKD
jgi:hypothetical protein